MSGTAAVCHMPWCVCHFACKRYLFYSFIGTFPRFTNTFLLYRWIHPSAVLVCFGVYPLIAILLCWLLRDFFHTSVPILMYYIRLGFTLQPISSSLRFSCLCCEDIIMFSLYLSLKVDYRPNHRPVICTELTYSR